MESDAQAITFEPASLLTTCDSPDSSAQALVILNQPIASVALLDAVWARASFRVCADGGANRLYELFGDDDGARKSHLPNLVHGDLDSLQPHVRTYYEDHGVTVSVDSDQYSTDFGKALKKIRSFFANSPHADVLLLGSLAGRLDQGVGMLAEIMREQVADTSPSLTLYLLSESSLSWILPIGTHRLLFPGFLEQAKANKQRANKGSGKVLCPFTPNVGILPIYGAATISTAGLEWDVHDWPTSMTGQLSTSNHVVAEEVVVGVRGTAVLFTIERWWP